MADVVYFEKCPCFPLSRCPSASVDLSEFPNTESDVSKLSIFFIRHDMTRRWNFSQPPIIKNLLNFRISVPPCFQWIRSGPIAWLRRTPVICIFIRPISPIIWYVMQLILTPAMRLSRLHSGITDCSTNACLKK